MVKHLTSDQSSYRKQLQVLDGRYLHKHYSHAHVHSCTNEKVKVSCRGLAGTGALHLSAFPSLQLPSCGNRKSPRWRPSPWQRPKRIQPSGIAGNVSGLSQQLEGVKRKISGGSNRSWAHIPGWPWPPTQGRLETGPAVAEDGGHSLIFTIAKECNLEFKITQINCLLKQNSALFCLGIYIIQIKKSAKKQKLCWCMRLGHCVQRRKLHVNIQYLDSMAHSEKEMRPGITVTWKRVARGIKSGVQRSWWWPGDRACVAICPISLKPCSKLLSEAIPKHWSH